MLFNQRNEQPNPYRWIPSTNILCVIHVHTDLVWLTINGVVRDRQGLINIRIISPPCAELREDLLKKGSFLSSNQTKGWSHLERNCEAANRSSGSLSGNDVEDRSANPRWGKLFFFTRTWLLNYEIKRHKILLLLDIP